MSLLVVSKSKGRGSWGLLSLLWALSVTGCATHDSDGFLELSGLGNYHIRHHWVARGDCGAEPSPVEDVRCIGLVPQSGGILLQDCIGVSQESLRLNVELDGEGPVYRAIRHTPVLCEETCIAGRSDQCTDTCLGERSCRVRSESFEAHHDLSRRSLRLEIEHYSVEFELAVGDYCTSAPILDLQRDSTCVSVDVYDADWQPE